jgi:hypothetical protein
MCGSPCTSSVAGLRKVYDRIAAACGTNRSMLTASTRPGEGMHRSEQAGARDVAVPHLPADVLTQTELEPVLPEHQGGLVGQAIPTTSGEKARSEQPQDSGYVMELHVTGQEPCGGGDEEDPPSAEEGCRSQSQGCSRRVPTREAENFALDRLAGRRG